MARGHDADASCRQLVEERQDGASGDREAVARAGGVEPPGDLGGYAPAGGSDGRNANVTVRLLRAEHGRGVHRIGLVRGLVALGSGSGDGLSGLCRRDRLHGHGFDGRGLDGGLHPRGPLLHLRNGPRRRQGGQLFVCDRRLGRLDWLDWLDWLVDHGGILGERLVGHARTKVKMRATMTSVTSTATMARPSRLSSVMTTA